MFSNYFNESETDSKTTELPDISVQRIEENVITEKEVIDTLKKAGIKPKLINPTNFGIEVIFYRNSDAEDAVKLFDKSKSSIKNNSIFISY